MKFTIRKLQQFVKNIWRYPIINRYIFGVSETWWTKSICREIIRFKTSQNSYIKDWGLLPWMGRVISWLPRFANGCLRVNTHSESVTWLVSLALRGNSLFEPLYNIPSPDQIAQIKIKWALKFPLWWGLVSLQSPLCISSVPRLLYVSVDTKNVLIIIVSWRSAAPTLC